jgi:hypothetical protein
VTKCVLPASKLGKVGSEGKTVRRKAILRSVKELPAQQLMRTAQEGSDDWFGSHNQRAARSFV